jgi:hypothetical protein
LSVVPPSFPQLVNAAEQVVQVEIKAVACRWDTTPTGQAVIHTYVECQVQEVLKGTAGDRLILRFLGGQVGNDHMEIADMPAMEVGGVYVLFLAQNGQAFCPLVRAMHGSYRIVRDPQTGREHVTRHNGEALRSVDDVHQPLPMTRRAAPDLSGLSPAAFKQAIVAERRIQEGTDAR